MASNSPSDACQGEEKKVQSKLLIMRHGERCDFAFGRSWMSRCFDDKGKYRQADLNLPSAMVPRESYKDFQKDSPLSEIGRFQARSTGEAMKRAGVNITQVYSSPALRCVQTAQNVIDGLGSGSQIQIEPMAFEWFGWYKSAMPKWISPENLVKNGFSVDTQHKPLSPVKCFPVEESVSDYYTRCNKLCQLIIDKHKHEGGYILIVAHAGSLDTFTLQLRGKRPRDSKEMHEMLSNFTYCCLCCCAQESSTGKWMLEQPPIPPLYEFNWKALIS